MTTFRTAALLSGFAMSMTVMAGPVLAQGFGGGPGAERKGQPGFSYGAQQPKTDAETDFVKPKDKKRREGERARPRDEKTRPAQNNETKKAAQPPWLRDAGDQRGQPRDGQRNDPPADDQRAKSEQRKREQDGERRNAPDNRNARDGRSPFDAKATVKPAEGSPPLPGKQREFRRAGRDRGGPSTIDQIKSARRERSEAGGKRVVIEEPGRTIVKQNNRIVIQQDETERMRRLAPNARIEKRGDGKQVSIVERADKNQIITETDARGQMIRRYRRDRDGRETDIVDNRKRNRLGRDLAIGAGIGVGVVAGAAILDSLVRVPPPRVRIPRDKYIVRYEGASEDDVYEALNAPPVDEIDGRYTLDQVRATPFLRDRMRRVDLDDITFDFGSWDVDPREFGKLERVARAMRRVIRRNPNEVFLIEGYTDAVGSQIDNLTLSDRRAESVADILTQEFDVPFENLVTQGYGEDYLKIQTLAPERLNRRVAARRVTPLIADRNAPPPRAYDESRNSDRDLPDYDERSDGGRDEPEDGRFDDRRTDDRGDDYGRDSEPRRY